ncbi:hypothetical protein SDC9_133484 [bioreactor metagenome]|uniref:DUF4352 domain-containing protein n=1 Tax=bioreactor metagenome TaxID=1076179 RepID=A0A645DAX7_9ZZZZ
MKRLFIAAMALLLVMFLFACGSNETATQTPEQPAPSGETTPPPEAPAETKEASYEVTYTNCKLWKDSIGSVWGQTIVEISNTGTENLYLSTGSYDLEDKDGNLVASKTLVSTYPDVLAPGEKGYMYEETTLDDVDTSMALTVIARPDVEKSTSELVRFPVTDTKISDAEYGGVKMLGRVENTSKEAQSMVYIVAFLYDSNGTMIGSMFTILSDELAAGDKIGFEMQGFSLPDNVTASSVANYVVYAYPYQMQF